VIRPVEACTTPTPEPPTLPLTLATCNALTPFLTLLGVSKVFITLYFVSPSVVLSGCPCVCLTPPTLIVHLEWDLMPCPSEYRFFRRKFRKWKSIVCLDLFRVCLFRLTNSLYGFFFCYPAWFAWCHGCSNSGWCAQVFPFVTSCLFFFFGSRSGSR